MKRLLLSLAFAIATLSLEAQQNATYTNPALAGDYPDPSVIRVGNDYWATATSSEFAAIPDSSLD
jgi:xylan 1,4-beta-xylosidase